MNFIPHRFKKSLLSIGILCFVICYMVAVLYRECTQYYGSNQSEKSYGKYFRKINNIGNTAGLSKAINRNATAYGTYVEKIDENCLKNDCLYDEKSPNIWARKKIHVKVIPDNEVNTFKKNPLAERSPENDSRKEHELLLPPSIVTVWAYELGFALTAGIDLKQ